MLKSIAENSTSLFGRVRKIVAKELFLREIISNSIKSISGVYIPITSIKVSGSIAKITTNTNSKSLIFTKKPRIIEAITNSINGQSLDTRITDLQ